MGFPRIDNVRRIQQLNRLSAGRARGSWQPDAVPEDHGKGAGEAVRGVQPRDRIGAGRGPGRPRLHAPP